MLEDYWRGLGSLTSKSDNSLVTTHPLSEKHQNISAKTSLNMGQPVIM